MRLPPQVPHHCKNHCLRTKGTKFTTDIGEYICLEKSTKNEKIAFKMRPYKTK